MGAKEGALILDLIRDLKERGDVSMIMIAHNYAQVLEVVRPDQPAARRRDRVRQAGPPRAPIEELTADRRQRVPCRTRHEQRIAEPTARSGSSPAASTCTATTRCARSASTRARSPRALDGAGLIPVRVVPKPVVDDAGVDPRRRASRRTPSDDCVGLIAWMHTFSPAKMWIAGLERAAEAAAAPAHAVQPRPAVGRDRHGLHEPEPVGARRPRVRVHRDAHAAPPQDGRRPLAATRRSPSGSAPGRARPAAGTRPAACRSPASATTCARSRSPRATRSRPSSGSASRSTATASATSSTPCGGRGRRGRPRCVGEYERAYDVAPALRRGGDRREALRDAARSRPACAGSSRRAASGPSPTPSRTSTASTQLPGIAVQRLMADGYGFGAEGDWKTAALVRIVKVMGAGLAGGTSFMEDYTYHLAPGRPEGARGAHARGLPLDRGRPAVVRDPPAVDRRQGGPGPARLHRRARTGGRGRDARPRRPLPAGRQRGRRRRAREALPQLPVARAVWRPRPDLRDRRRGVARRGRRRTTRCSATRIGIEALDDFAEIAGIELLVIDEGPACATSRRSCAGTRPTTTWPEASSDAAGRTSSCASASLAANRAIVDAGLVVLTFGNASALDRDAGVMAIKPSGVRTTSSAADDRRRRPRDRRGRRRRPAAVLGHADAPRALPPLRGVGGIVHTHSTVRPPGPRRGGRSRASAPPTPTTSAAACRSPAT